jgi:hypothetical protein
VGCLEILHLETRSKTYYKGSIEVSYKLTTHLGYLN